VREMLQQRHAVDGVAFAVSPLATLDELATTHDREYVRRYLDNEFTPRENRVVGFPWSTQSVNRSLSSVGGTVAAARVACARLNPAAPSSDLALRPAVVGHIAGCTHHAFAAHGEGFCVFSDIAVAANVCLEEHGEWLQRVLIIDLDVHQGNGNAVLFEQDPRVFTFSMQCRENLFSAEQCSDKDVYVNEGTGDEGYLAGIGCVLTNLYRR
jgi:acetoin utilization deacetylase AcuC-like enzyme